MNWNSSATTMCTIGSMMSCKDQIDCWPSIKLNRSWIISEIVDILRWCHLHHARHDSPKPPVVQIFWRLVITRQRWMMISARLRRVSWMKTICLDTWIQQSETSASMKSRLRRKLCRQMNWYAVSLHQSTQASAEVEWTDHSLVVNRKYGGRRGLETWAWSKVIIQGWNDIRRPSHMIWAIWAYRRDKVKCFALDQLQPWILTRKV